MQLTTNFSLAEMCRSARAEECGIDNTAPPSAVENGIALARDILQPLRDHYDAAVSTWSWFRCAALNREVGGAATSQHLTADAADVNVAGRSAHEVAWWIAQSDLPFDQVIWERKPSGVEWVHVSRAAKPRRQALMATFDANGKPTYAPLEAPSS